MTSLTSRILRSALLPAVVLSASLQFAPAQDVPKGDIVAVKIKLRDEEHWIQIKLDEDAAPRHCANFKILAEGNYYAGMAFHRVIRDYLVQTGDPLTKDESEKRNWGTGGAGYDLAPEIGLPHKRGAVGMARLRTSNPKKRSSGCQFYIMLTNASNLDDDYTVFGEVVEGLDTVGRMSRARVDSNDVPLERIEVVETRIGEPGFLNAITDPITSVPGKMAEIPNPLSALRNPFARKNSANLSDGEDSSLDDFKKAQVEFKKSQAQAKANARADAKAQAKIDTAADAEASPKRGFLRNPFARKTPGDGDASLEPEPIPVAPEREIKINEVEAAEAKEKGGFGGLFGRKDKAPKTPKPPRQKKNKKTSEPAPDAADAAEGEEKKPGPLGRFVKKIW